MPAYMHASVLDEMRGTLCRIKHVPPFTAIFVLQTMPPGTPTVALPTCGHCGRADATIRLKCSRCKQQYYCDKQCQVGAWSRHKKSCIAAS